MAFLVGFSLFCVGSVFAHPFTHLGDLPLENPDLFGGDILLQDPEDRNAVVSKFQVWPGGIVPYEEDPGLNKTVMRFILERAFNHYLKHTCIKFVPRTNEHDYIRIFPGQGCYSYVGRVGGQQPVSLGLGCGWEATIIHELGHAVGFYHEQNRSDRDDYLTIYWENIKEGAEDQFMKLKPNQNQLLTPFDYESIMLYGSMSFSKDRKKLRTMEGKNGEYLRDVFSKGKLSPSDIQRIKKLYKC
ncbi:astacin-like metalloprotease toxin 1 [Argiope bruennichi]|uniref:Metalloendopeptidase n=1 Tax=Argiope bruennichi TaxID=94029 RepID=A0A8T0E4N7_ARGBR|nr:astacin-like metalloprotease toxin 1 [Argiope bruennichi]KAF8765217.1 Astacin-like metalloprotease toxin 1 [Argiope bruennichi]